MTTGAALILVALGYSVLTVSYAFIVSAFLAILFSLLLIAKKISRFVADIDREFIMKFLKMSVPFAAGLILYTVYFRADVLLINFLKGSVSTGVYNSAFQFVELILFIPLFVSIAVFPLLSQAYVRSERRFWKIYGKMMKALCIVSVPIVAGTLILGDRLILLIFGGEYSGAGQVLKILIVFTFFNFFNQFHNTVIVSMNREKKLITLMGIVFILNLCLNYFFISSFSIFGAAYVKVFSEIVYLIGALIIIRPKIDIAALLVLLKTFFVGAVMFSIVMYATHLNLFFIISIAAVSYALLVLVFRIFSDEDFSLMSEIMRR
jgi:O-antigen/teichoic acid export membrane protein